MLAHSVEALLTMFNSSNIYTMAETPSHQNVSISRLAEEVLPTPHTIDFAELMLPVMLPKNCMNIWCTYLVAAAEYCQSCALDFIRSQEVAATGDNKGISLSGFLNIIDGVASSEGRILVMTTNHMENLDHALLRPGRCDLIVHFNYATAAMIRGLFVAIYSAQDPEDAAKKMDNMDNINKAERRASFTPIHGRTEAEVSQMADKFAEILPADKFTPAEIQGYLLQHKIDPEGAVEGLEHWIQEREDQKKKT